MGHWPRVTRRNPCRICGRGDFCQISFDGNVAGCMRVSIGAFKSRATAVGECHFHRLGADPSVRRAIADSSQAVRTVATPGVRDAAYSFVLDRLTLSARHGVQLMERGLGEEEIARNCYATAGSQQQMSALAEAVAKRADLAGVPGLSSSKQNGWKVLADEGDLLVPVRNERFQIVGIRRRTDNPERRYLWLSSAHAPSGAPVHHAEPWNAGFRPVIVVSEGELKSDLIAQRLRFTVVGLPGVGAIPAGFGTTLQQAYPTVRTAFVAFDSDTATNPRVRDSRDRLVRSLNATGYNVHILEWDGSAGGKGLDDVLAGVAA